MVSVRLSYLSVLGFPCLTNLLREEASRPRLLTIPRHLWDFPGRFRIRACLVPRRLRGLVRRKGVFFTPSCAFARRRRQATDHRRHWLLRA